MTKWNGLHRTPLRRGSPAPGNPLSTIPKVSAKRKKENRERTKVLAELRRLHPYCQRCARRPSEDGHEPLMRSRGGSITDPAGIVMLCRSCHRWVHANPAEATKEGLMVSRYA